jgi:excisionase family DNA binding protein
VTDRIALRPREAAAILGIRPETVRELCRSGELPYRRVGKTFLISRLALEAWLAGAEEKELLNGKAGRGAS